MRNKFLVFGKPHFGREEIREITSTIKSGWWGTGPKTELFEKKFKEYANAKYSLGVNSATAGLHLALLALGVGPGDEVITTPLTFCSTVNVILHCGATPIFADVDINDWNIDPKEIEKKITKKTKVIMPVHLHGRPCNMDEIKKIAKKYKLFVVEDAAHAVEAVYKEKKIGSISDVTVFSFYVTKNLAVGEGGMVTTKNKKLIDRIRVLSLHGLSRDAYKRYSVKSFKNYECLYPGFKYNLTDLASSLGIHQLERISKNAKKRKKYWDMYNKGFSGFENLIIPSPEGKNTYHARHLYAVLLPIEKMKIGRDKFIDNLIKENIGSGVHFNPVHLHKYYREKFGFKKGDFPSAEYVGERIISLPLSAGLKEKDVRDVITTMKKLLEKYIIKNRHEKN